LHVSISVTLFKTVI